MICAIVQVQLYRQTCTPGYSTVHTMVVRRDFFLTLSALGTNWDMDSQIVINRLQLVEHQSSIFTLLCPRGVLSFIMKIIRGRCLLQRLRLQTLDIQIHTPTRAVIARPMHDFENTCVDWGLLFILTSCSPRYCTIHGTYSITVVVPTNHGYRLECNGSYCYVSPGTLLEVSFSFQ